MAQTSLVTPRSTVESFHYTTETDFRIVGDFGYRQLVVVDELLQCLYGIVSTLFIVTRQDDFLLVDAEEITFVLLRDELVVFTNRFVSTFANVDTDTFLGRLLAVEQRLQGADGVWIGFAFAVELIATAQSDGFCSFLDLLRSRLYIYLLSIHSHA